MKTVNYQDVKMLRYWNNLPCGTVVRNYKLDEFGERINTILPEFLESGLLRTSTGAENASRATVPELKELLKQRGLSAAGKKPELIQRVCDNFSEQELEARFTEAFYTLTEEGRRAINFFELFFLNDEFGCNFMSEELGAAKNAQPNEEPIEILRKLLLQRFSKEFATKDQRIRVTCNCMIRILKRKNDYQNMLLFLWTAAYHEMCGCERLSEATYYVYRTDFPLRPPSCIKDFDLCKVALGWSLEEFQSYIRKKAFPRAMEMPFSFLTNEELLKVVCDQLTGNGKPITPENYSLALPVENHPDYNYYAVGNINV